jgi:hypothetical protein
VTVEFGVLAGCADELSGVRTDPAEPLGPIRAVWDNYLPDGKTFTAYIPGKVYRRLKGFAPADAKELVEPREGENVLDPLRTRVARHIEEHGVRITGRVESDAFGNYFITVSDPAQVVTYIKGSGE